MHPVIFRLQLLLTAVSAFLPLIPADGRARAGEVLNMAAKALAAGAVVSVNVDELAQKLSHIRADVEAMAAAGRPVSAEELDAAMIRVRTA